MDSFFHGTWRMDWGLGNPNKTAAVIAGLMVAAWAWAVFRKWGFWVGLFLCTGLGTALLHTFSRGGALAALAGLLAVGFGAERPWPRAKAVAVLSGLLVLAAYGFYLKAGDRYTSGILEEDRSITNRLELWKAAPAMMVDAPDGWGLGNSGTAYMQWYQPLDRNEGYRTMVNSHLTWLVELGWPWRFLYLLAWAAVFCLCCPSKQNRFLHFVVFGCWLSLAVASVFSSVGESPWVWVMPGTALVMALGLRWRGRDWPAGRTWAGGLALAVALTMGLLILGSVSNPGLVHCKNGAVILGRGPTGIWIVSDEDTFGKYFGPPLRRAFAESLESASVAVSDRMPEPSITENGKLLVVARLNDKQADSEIFHRWLQSNNRVLLINPWAHPSRALSGMLEKGNLDVWIGQFSQAPSIASWENRKDIRMRVFDGVGDYSEDWFGWVREKNVGNR